MAFEAHHTLLVRGETFADCCARVELFFAKNFLVKYDSVTFLADESYAGADPSFWAALEEGIARNRQKIEELVGELKAAGFTGLQELVAMPQGYESKILHTITHLVDGFFGIDTCFFNLEEDSHGITQGLREMIKTHPEEYHLLSVVGLSGTGDTNRLDRIRKFEVNPQD